MATRVVLIIVQNEQILLLHRFKDGREYYVFPGGSMEEGETLEQAAVREAKEETGLDVSLGQLWWQYENNGRLENYFLVKDFSGEVQLGYPEVGWQTEANIYRPEWVPLHQLTHIPLLPEAAAVRLRELL